MTPEDFARSYATESRAGKPPFAIVHCGPDETAIAVDSTRASRVLRNMDIESVTVEQSPLRVVIIGRHGRARCRYAFASSELPHAAIHANAKWESRRGAPKQTEADRLRRRVARERERTFEPRRPHNPAIASKYGGIGTYDRWRWERWHKEKAERRRICAIVRSAPWGRDLRHVYAALREAGVKFTPQSKARRDGEAVSRCLWVERCYEFCGLERKPPTPFQFEQRWADNEARREYVTALRLYRAKCAEFDAMLEDIAA